MTDALLKTSIRRLPMALVLAAVLGVAGAGFLASRSRAEEARLVPPPKLDAAAGQPGRSEVAILAGGCFWGVQGVFQHLAGVSGAVSGYAGGTAATAQYDTVSGGTTGHAESVAITFDPAEISYGEILRVYFSVAHDPTQLNRQGPDHGTQYRSAIFPVSEAQQRIAKAYMSQLGQDRVFDAAIVTTIEPGRSFYPAEAYHQDFLARNPDHPYIVVNDLPKIAALKALFPDRYRETPVLVSAARSN